MNYWFAAGQLLGADKITPRIFTRLPPRGSGIKNLPIIHTKPSLSCLYVVDVVSFVLFHFSKMTKSALLKCAKLAPTTLQGGLFKHPGECAYIICFVAGTCTYPHFLLLCRCRTAKKNSSVAASSKSETILFFYSFLINENILTARRRVHN